MGHKLQYGVQFVGYGARVLAREYGREKDYAWLDFVSGGVSIHADGGWVMVRSRIDLKPFLKALPNLANQLRQLLAQHAAQVPGERVASDPVPTDMVRLSHGQNTVCVAPDTEVSKFIRQIVKRFTQVEQVLEQAEQIGSHIKRRPYAEYIEEISKTGLCRVEGHGFALFVHGRLVFYPRRQVILVKQQSPSDFDVWPAS